MPKVMKSATINAPVERVFNYATDQTNMPEIWPSMVDVKILEKLPKTSTGKISKKISRYSCRFKSLERFRDNDEFLA